MAESFGDLMRQAQQMQARVKELQDEIAQAELVGESGAGLVKVVMTGMYDVRRVTLDPSLMREEIEVVEDLIAAAVNNAVQRVEKKRQEKMSSLTAGLQLPPGFKLPL